MKPPKQTGPYPDRDLDCQLAVEDAIQKAITDAVAAGWSEQEAAAAALVAIHGFIIARGGRKALARYLAASELYLRDPRSEEQVH